MIAIGSFSSHFGKIDSKLLSDMYSGNNADLTISRWHKLVGILKPYLTPGYRW